MKCYYYTSPSEPFWKLLAPVVLASFPGSHVQSFRQWNAHIMFILKLIALQTPHGCESLVSCPDPTQLIWGERVWCHHEITFIIRLGLGISPRIQACDTRPLLLAWAGWGLSMRLVIAGEKFLLRVNTFSSHSHYHWVSNIVWCVSMKYGFLVQFRLSCHVIQLRVCIWSTYACGDSGSLKGPIL